MIRNWRNGDRFLAGLYVVALATVYNLLHIAATQLIWGWGWGWRHRFRSLGRLEVPDQVARAPTVRPSPSGAGDAPHVRRAGEILRERELALMIHLRVLGWVGRAD